MGKGKNKGGKGAKSKQQGKSSEQAKQSKKEERATRRDLKKERKRNRLDREGHPSAGRCLEGSAITSPGISSGSSFRR